MNKEQIDEKEVNENPSINDQRTEEANTPENKEEAAQEIEGPTEEREDTETSEKLNRINDELSESKDKYLRLYSEFENYRRRTSREKLDMVQTAHEDLMQALLPIIDDLERAQRTFEEKETDLNAVKEGVALISNKFKKTLEQKGLKVMDGTQGMTFDPELHEAITQIPAPKKSLKGKVVEVIEKGYILKEKVIRYAKVVIGN